MDNLLAKLPFRRSGAGSTPQRPTPPEIDVEKCTGCGLCVQACPVFVLEMRAGKASVARQEICIKCGHCGAVCPVGAVNETSTESDDVPMPGPKSRLSAEALLLLLRSRRSVRKYRGEPLPQNAIETILDAGRYAPTGGNRQNVSYIVLSSPAEIAELRRMTLSLMNKIFSLAGSKAVTGAVSLIAGEGLATMYRNYQPVVRIFQEREARGEDRLFYHAPAIILVHADRWDEAGAFNCSVALYNCSLMAHTLGIGCCFNGFLTMAVNRSPKIKKWLNIPRGHKCYGSMSMGYQDIKFKHLVRRRPPRVRWR